MADENVKPGFPVDGGADEKLAHLTKQITPAVMFSSDRKVDGKPVWSLMCDGSLELNGALVGSARPRGCFRARVKSLLVRLRTRFSRALQ